MLNAYQSEIFIEVPEDLIKVHCDAQTISVESFGVPLLPQCAREHQYRLNS